MLFIYSAKSLIIDIIDISRETSNIFRVKCITRKIESIASKFRFMRS